MIRLETVVPSKKRDETTCELLSCCGEGFFENKFVCWVEQHSDLLYTLENLHSDLSTLKVVFGGDVLATWAWGFWERRGDRAQEVLSVCLCIFVEFELLLTFLRALVPLARVISSN